MENSTSGISHHPKEDVLIEYVKEKDGLKAEIIEKDKEIQKLKSKVYDLREKIDELKKELKKLQTAKQSSLLPQPSNGSNKLAVSRPHTGRVRTPSTSKRLKSGKQKSSSKSSQNNSALGSQELTDNENNLKKRLEHLEEVAKRFPELKLSVVFQAEKLFREGDINKDGTIDEEEMEKLLTKQGHLFTNKELKDIMSQIDVDNNQSIDMMEYLAVMEKVQQRKRVDLPTAITRSAACVVQ